MRNAKSSQPSRSPRDVRRPARNPRSAFTLIELVVVIMIIVILAGLLMVGVQAAVGRARSAAVAADVANLQQGIKEFQAKFSITEAPPSGLILFETGADWADFSAGKNTQQNAALIRRLWPGFLKSNGRPDLNGDGLFNASDNQDINGNGSSTDTIRLNGAECLAFFLGGIMELGGTTPQTFIPHGFSANVANPFFRPAAGMNNWGARVGPFAEFRPARLMDDQDPIAGSLDNMPVYMDAFPASTTPYQYFSAYGGRGYQVFGVDGLYSTTAEKQDDEVIWISTSTPTLYSVYLQKDTQTMASIIPSVAYGTPWNAKGFQIISAGADGVWGIGGAVTDGGIPTDGTGTYRSYTVRLPERDNITNFKGGPLN